MTNEICTTTTRDRKKFLNLNSVEETTLENNSSILELFHESLISFIS